MQIWREKWLIHAFPRLLVLTEMQPALSRIWTLVSPSISYNCYIKHTSKIQKVRIKIYQWDISRCLQSQKHIILGLNEQVDRRSTSDKWWFVSCDCSILLACFIWRTFWDNCLQTEHTAKHSHNLLSVGDKVGVSL